MKPATFEYTRPTETSEAVELLATYGAGARVLAGGQSLMLELNYRRAQPALIVDINGIDKLVRLERAAGVLRVGALARHARFEAGSQDDPLERLLARVSHFVAHPPIRRRGTMVGSLAYAHPAAEWPAVALALDAQLTLVSAAGARTIRADTFFHGPFRTACRPEELVTELALPLLPPSAGIGFVEYRRTAASFAVVAAVAVLELEDGTVSNARVALAGAADRPLRARGAEQLLSGAAAEHRSLTAAAAAASAEARPLSEPHCSSQYRRQVIQVIVRRALEHAVADAKQS